MGVEGEVVGGQAHVVLEQELEAALERGIDYPRPRVPQDPVVDENQVRPLGRGPFEQFGVGRDAGDHRAHLGGARDLEPVGAVVLEGRRLEQAVQCFDYVPERGDVTGTWRKRPETVQCPASRDPWKGSLLEGQGNCSGQQGKWRLGRLGCRRFDWGRRGRGPVLRLPAAPIAASTAWSPQCERVTTRPSS